MATMQEALTKEGEEQEKSEQGRVSFFVLSSSYD
jgi:hypothetical protein